MENLEEAIRDVLKVGNAFGKSLEDNNISLTEGVDLLIKSTSLADDVQNIKAIYQEYVSLTDAQKLELVNKFKDDFDIPQDNIEMVIESVIVWLLASEGVVNAIKGSENSIRVRIFQS